MQKQYELTVVFEPNIQGSHGEEARKNVEDILAKVGAKIVVSDDWGEKKMAYAIHSHDVGHYVLYGIELDNKELSGLEQKVAREKGVLRHLVVLAETPLSELKTAAVDTK